MFVKRFHSCQSKQTNKHTLLAHQPYKQPRVAFLWLPCRFNVEYAWCACRTDVQEEGERSKRDLLSAALCQNKKNMLPAASKLIILQLHYHQDSQVAFNIDAKL